MTYWKGKSAQRRPDYSTFSKYLSGQNLQYIYTSVTSVLQSPQSTPNIHQHAHQREYILIDTKIVKIGYPQAELGQEGHLTLLDLM